MAFGFFIDVFLILFTFYLIIIYKEKIADFFMQITFLPKVLVALISSIPFIIFEENINCGAIGCVFTFFPWTMPFLIIFLVILFGITKILKVKNQKVILFGFTLWGALYELFHGAGSAELKALPLFFFIFMFVYVMISYAYITIIPLEIFLREKK